MNPHSWRLVNVIYLYGENIYVVCILCIYHVFRYENNPQLHMPHVPFFSLSKVQLPRWHSHHWRGRWWPARPPPKLLALTKQQASARSPASPAKVLVFGLEMHPKNKRLSKTNQKETSTCCWIRTCCWVLVLFVAFLFTYSITSNIHVASETWSWHFWQIRSNAVWHLRNHQLITSNN